MITRAHTQKMRQTKEEDEEEYWTTTTTTTKILKSYYINRIKKCEENYIVFLIAASHQFGWQAYTIYILQNTKFTRCI